MCEQLYNKWVETREDGASLPGNIKLSFPGFFLRSMLKPILEGRML